MGDGTYVRDTRYLDARITADGRDGWPVEPGRYRLAVARACPWANRAVIVRRLMGLESVISMAMAGPVHDKRSWTFDLDPGGRDPVLGIERLAEAYEKAVPGYDRGVTVPAIVDVPSGAVVTNDYGQITLDLETEWTALARADAPDLYPEKHRDEIDEVAALVYKDVNNGVYQAGFASSQRAYEAAYGRLFKRLDWLSERLAGQRFLVGDTITEADIRLFTTLARFERGLPRPLQVQPVQAVGDAGAVGVRARPVPDARVRRHDRLRPDQGALLYGAPDDQPERDRPGGPGPVELADAARPRSPGRTSVRRWHTAPAAATLGDRAACAGPGGRPPGTPRCAVLARGDDPPEPPAALC